ncbi:hypothetical protein [Leifsonella bigeumensis]|uniref:hypothetical protein n=1 Tax=Leifsonella bigeumensis TaxID=433643 RepID=UPI0031D858C3
MRLRQFTGQLERDLGPEVPAPTMSTGPPATEAGLRYLSECICRVPASRPAAKPGTAGTRAAPLAVLG